MSPRKKPKNGLIVIDLLIVGGSYIAMAGLKPVMSSYLTTRYVIAFGVLLAIWIISSFYFKKFHISRNERPTFLIRNIMVPNLVSLAFVSFIIYASLSFCISTVPSINLYVLNASIRSS